MERSCRVGLGGFSSSSSSSSIRGSVLIGVDHLDGALVMNTHLTGYRKEDMEEEKGDGRDQRRREGGGKRRGIAPIHMELTRIKCVAFFLGFSGCTRQNPKAIHAPLLLC